MSEVVSSGEHAAVHHGHGHTHVQLDPAGITPGPGFGRLVMLGLGIVGVLLLVIALVVGLIVEGAGKHLLLAYHVGTMWAIGIPLGAMGLVMIMHQVNAGWSVTLRRQLENIMSLLPLGAVLFLPLAISTFVAPGKVWKWMSPAYYDDATGRPLDHLLEVKAPYLNLGFFTARWVLYFAVWIILSQLLFRWSREQDVTGDYRLTARARRLSAIGLVLFALTTAFAAFDWMMALDYHWFSTMFGVYFFAGNNLAAVAMTVVVLAVLLSTGKLKGVVTPEHFHDLGKLVFAFTVFWAYIAFSQYFLIWYSNIPEETAWYIMRRENGWMTVAVALCVLHFALPFIILIWRRSKRSPLILGATCAFLLVMHAVDLFFIIRPYAYATQVGFGPLDLVGTLGPVCLLLAGIAWRVSSGPLIPLKDPRLPESLEHANYV